MHDEQSWMWTPEQDALMLSLIEKGLNLLATRKFMKSPLAVHSIRTFLAARSGIVLMKKTRMTTFKKRPAFAGLPLVFCCLSQISYVRLSPFKAEVVSSQLSHSPIWVKPNQSLAIELFHQGFQPFKAAIRGMHDHISMLD